MSGSNELPTGYIRTEIGVVPEDWEIKPLGTTLSKARLGGNYPNQDQESGHPLMKMGNIARGQFDLTKVEYINPGVRPDGAHRLARGDVLFNTRNTLELVGKVAMWRNELPVAYYNSNLLRLEFDPLRVGCNEYANLFLNTSGSVARLRAMATGTTSVAAIYTRDLFTLPMALPPLPEQRTIAEALSDTDALLAGLDRLIAKKRDLKHAAMQQLLTGQTRLPGFRDKWKSARAREVGAFRDGNGFPLSAQGERAGEYPFFKVSDMNNVENKTFMTTSNNWISEATRKALGAITFPAGAIVFAKVGAAVFLERKKILNVSSCIDNNMAAFVLDRSAANVRFVHFLLLHRRLSDLVSTTALPALSGRQLGEMEFSLPPLVEQRAIADVLCDMENELAAQEARRAKTLHLKQAMMQELLTGRIRLI